ncbi:unnamed protein product [Aphanomyces euteiches]|uniref:SLC41A/MgtE integral membrane domain-containing protein n=1 Tax=Aphanomyces euteiches TaxID=100861 RepID=A0A6G0WJ49_9STRA|nr:hypothetical protein Ae201684_014757 [Aphanomyces euteiches]KAH9077991.1 hypothetical protein Ae201684P_019097 [Aphanomyces euteiches]KAH9114480.1 hypothetical protein LEN26_013037 [Aphanomyces euteiches]KAH9129875.1 hypothetical protein AeMF1_000141 [Aphanomyces euteiches]KAH9158009.1 hypothetical protein AeRB84_000247 [Aphanomyces euteiches]
MGKVAPDIYALEEGWIEFQDVLPITERDPAFDAVIMHQLPAFERARRRLFSLVVTFSIEMLVAFVISRYTTTLRTYPLLMSFMPVISAISGNVGLQSSSITTRALALGLVSTKDSWYAIGREMASGAVLGIVLGVITGIVAGLWQQWAVFGIVVGVAQFLSIVTASLTGSAAPLIGKSLHMDPATFAGPMETAIQDVVGNSFFLMLASVLLEYFAHLRPH